MHEQVTVVIRVSRNEADYGDWEVVGIYIPNDADNAIAYFEAQDGASDYEYAKYTASVLAFPKWAVDA